MAQETVITKKRRGPAPSGKGTLIGVRLQPEQLDKLDAWREALSATKPSRPAAVRMLLDLGLDREKER